LTFITRFFAPYGFYTLIYVTIFLVICLFSKKSRCRPISVQCYKMIVFIKSFLSVWNCMDMQKDLNIYKYPWYACHILWGFFCGFFLLVMLCFLFGFFLFFFCIGLHLLFFENKQITKKIVTYNFKHKGQFQMASIFTCIFVYFLCIYKR
jgi:hypothetical protein